MKKYRIALVIILAVVFMVGVIALISFMKNLNDSDVSQKDISQEDEEEYIPSGSFIADFVLTEQEVYRINNNSNLLGASYLAKLLREQLQLYQIQLEVTPKMSIFAFHI